jgi:hypothetical protein
MTICEKVILHEFISICSEDEDIEWLKNITYENEHETWLELCDRVEYFEWFFGNSYYHRYGGSIMNVVEYILSCNKTQLTRLCRTADIVEATSADLAEWLLKVDKEYAWVERSFK